MNNITLSISQLGFLPDSVKMITLMDKEGNGNIPNKIPFYIQKSGDRLKRKLQLPAGWNGIYFRWPFNIGSGLIDENEENEKSVSLKPLYKGWLIKQSTRWGDVWQAEFSDFNQVGVFQIETQYQITTPFEIGPDVYKRTIRSYLQFINAQRSGFDNPGIRRALHLDDARLDTTGEQIDASGGWYDAGDYRKWLGLTFGNIEALSKIAVCGISRFEELAKDEIKWGNKYFHSMINEHGQVYEDVGGGDFKGSLNYEDDWWYENHPGCNCDGAGTYETDNVTGSGDERKVRTTYNPCIQFQFVLYQSMVSKVFNDEYGKKCRQLAIKAWDYAIVNQHDNRTLFLSAQIKAALELNFVCPDYVSDASILHWINQLIDRQNKDNEGVSGFFTEAGYEDGFRSIIYSCFPIDAICAAYRYFKEASVKEMLKESIQRYIDRYVLEDAKSNPFGVNPYGIYLKTPHKEFQTFRPAGQDKYIRTFIHPINDQEIIHGTNSVVTHHSGLLIELAFQFDRPDWRTAGEKMLQWSFGHNVDAVSLFSGIGYRIPVAFSAVHPQIPDAAYAGYIGTPDDVPYQETSNWTEWSTQEMWDVPFYGVIRGAVLLI